MRRFRSVLVAVVALLLVATMAMAAAGPNPGSGSTDVRFLNVSDSSAVVTIDYYNPSGVIEATKSANVASRGAVDFLASDSGLGDGWNGAGVISSDQEGASVAFIYWTGGQSADQTTAAAYSGVPMGATTLYCPSLAARNNVQKSLVAVQNADTGNAEVELYFYDRAGNAWSGNPVRATIAEGASKVWDLTDLGLPVTTPPGDGWLGSVKITSSNGKKLAAVVTMLWRDFSQAYNCLSQGDTELVFPNIKRRYINGKWAEDGGNIIQNLGSQTANITVYFLNRDGQVLYQFDDTIAPNAAKGYNTRFCSNYPAGLCNRTRPNHTGPVFDALGNNFVGGLRVTSNNGQPLAAVYLGRSFFAGGSNTPRASMYQAEGTSTGSTNIFYPAVYRVKAGSAWARYTSVFVQNVSNNPANVTVKWYRKDGSLAYQFTDTIPAGTNHGYNTRFKASLKNRTDVYNELMSALGDNFMGSVEVTSNVPIVGVADIIYADQQAAYNAYKK